MRGGRVARERRDELTIHGHEEHPDDRRREVERDARRHDQSDRRDDEAIPKFAEMLDERKLFVARVGGHPEGHATSPPPRTYNRALAPVAQRIERRPPEPIVGT